MPRTVDGLSRVPATALRRSLRVPVRGNGGVAKALTHHVTPATQPAKTQHPYRHAKRLAGAAHRVHLLELAIARQLRQKQKRTERLRMAGRLAALFVLATSLYVTYDTWPTNQALRAQLQGSQTAVAAVSVTDTATAQDRQQAEGRDETEPKGDWLAKYAVAPDLPRVLTIPKINVTARVMPMSVNSDGAMQAPINIFDAGWYTGGVRPGDKGAAVIDGHASGPTRTGIFAYLDSLKPGDSVSIERGDGTQLNYQVVETKKVPRDALDMKELMTPKGGEEGLNLITCTGTWLQQGQTYSDRALVFTKRV